jgi:EAL domain-containing protein (putative c-di-GMP-specific phosphodiesterase class I)
VQQQLAVLGCDVIQGCHIGRPAPAEQLVELLRISVNEAMPAA